MFVAVATSGVLLSSADPTSFGTLERRPDLLVPLGEVLPDPALAPSFSPVSIWLCVFWLDTSNTISIHFAIYLRRDLYTVLLTLVLAWVDP